MAKNGVPAYVEGTCWRFVLPRTCTPQYDVHYFFFFAKRLFEKRSCCHLLPATWAKAKGEHTVEGASASYLKGVWKCSGSHKSGHLLRNVRWVVVVVVGGKESM